MNTYVIYLVSCVLLVIMAGCDSAKSKPAGAKLDVSGPNPDVNNLREKANADSFFAEKTIFATKPIHPLRLAGAMAWKDRLPDGKEHWEFTRLQPKLNMPDADFVNTIIFSAIVDKGFSAGVSYLAFASTSLTGEDKAEVYVENVFRALGPEYNDPEVGAQIASFKENNKKVGREFYYVEAMQYSTIKFKRLKKVSGNFKASYFVGIDGAAYSTNERFSLRDLVAVEMINVTGERDIKRPRERGPAVIQDFVQK